MEQSERRLPPLYLSALATLTQPLYTGGSLIAQKKVAQADEALAQLTTELTLDQIHYQSDASIGMPLPPVPV